jgi:curved DNA-binding protein CbpA
MSFIDYYDILQVSPNAHVEVIKSSYRTIMSKLNMHPDKGGDEEIAKLINEAYEVLSNEQLRAKYDKQYYSQIPPANRKGRGVASNKNKLSDTSWESVPLTEMEINEIAYSRLNKLVDFENFKTELKNLIKNTKG